MHRRQADTYMLPTGDTGTSRDIYGEAEESRHTPWIRAPVKGLTKPSVGIGTLPYGATVRRYTHPYQQASLGLKRPIANVYLYVVTPANILQLDSPPVRMVVSEMGRVRAKRDAAYILNVIVIR